MQLTPDQSAAVLSVLTDGKRVSVINAPARGKTRVMTEAARVWAAAGRPVVGITPSQSARNTLAAGVAGSYDTAQFLGYLPGQRGARGPLAIAEGALLLVDESSMISAPIWWPDYIEQSFKGSAEVGDRLFLRRAIADRADAGAELGGGAPDTVLVLLGDVGHVNDTSHDTQHGRPWSAMARPSRPTGCPRHSPGKEHQTWKQAAALSQTAEPPEPKKRSTPVVRTRTQKWS